MLIPRCMNSLVSCICFRCWHGALHPMLILKHTKILQVFFLCRLKWSDFSGCFLNRSIHCPSALCKTIKEENLYVCLQCRSCKFKANCHVGHLGSTVLFLSVGHTSFPGVQAIKDQRSYEGSSPASTPSASGCSQGFAGGELRERALLGLALPRHVAWRTNMVRWTRAWPSPGGAAQEGSSEGSRVRAGFQEMVERQS